MENQLFKCRVIVRNANKLFLYNETAKINAHYDNKKADDHVQD